MVMVMAKLKAFQHELNNEDGSLYFSAHSH